MNRETEELLSAFARLTRMHLSVYDSEFCPLFSAFSPETTRFCGVLHQASETLDLCIASDLSAKQACLESGKLYAYTCPFGLFEAIVPIYVCGSLNGFLVAGKSLPQGAESNVKRLSEAYLLGEEHRKELSKAMELLGRHTAEEYRDLCLLLQALVDRIVSIGGLTHRCEGVPAGVRRYLKRNFHTQITLAELSLTFHCSTVSLTKWYYREYGKTILEELTEIRMEKAKELLASSDASITVIAASCGFPDAGYFSKSFRKHVGYTPTEWRTLHHIL